MLAALLLAAAAPASLALAQVPPPWSVQPAPDLAESQHECDAASQRVAQLRREHRRVHREVNPRGPQIATLASLGTAAALGALFGVGRAISHEDGRKSFDVPLAIGVTVPVAVAIPSALFWRRSRVESAPLRPRRAELERQLEDARLAQYALCRRTRS
jgi:hypothetical protein